MCGSLLPHVLMNGPACRCDIQSQGGSGRWAPYREIMDDWEQADSDSSYKSNLKRQGDTLEDVGKKFKVQRQR